MDLYAENILDHFKHPRGKTAVASPSIEHEEINRSCGDKIAIQMTVDGDRISQLGWSGEGCAISQAAMSLLTEELAGKHLSDIDAMTPASMRELLGVTVSTRRLQCAMLALHALKNLVRLHRGQSVQGFAETVAEAERTT